MPDELLPTQGSAKPNFPEAVTNHASDPVEVDHMKRKLKIYSLTESELESLAEGKTSLNVTLFGICFSAFVSLVSALLSIGPGSETAAKALRGLTVMFLLGSIVFGIGAWRANQQLQRQLLHLKQAHDEANQNQE